MNPERPANFLFKQPSPLNTQILTIGAIFLIEAMLMLILLPYMAPIIPIHDLWFTDSFFLSLVLIPILYRLIYKPMNHSLQVRKNAEEELKKIVDTLEAHVSDRTDELVRLSKLMQKEYTEALRLSEENYKRVIDNLGVGVAVISPDLVVLTVNRQIQQWFPDIDFTGRPKCSEACGCVGQKGECRHCSVSNALQDGQVHETVRKIEFNGQVNYRKVMAFPVKDKNGHVVEVTEVMVDITSSVIQEQLAKERTYWLERKVRERTEELDSAYAELVRTKDYVNKTVRETVNALIAISEKRDPYIAGHQQRVAKLALAMARELGLSEKDAEGVYVAGKLHDIGKILVPADILNKPGRLNAFEMEIIKTHPQVAYEVLGKIPFECPVAETILQHHERFDGSGYPYGLAGENISLPARILAVADVVEAMASHRPYRPAIGLEAAIEEIIRNAGILYDPRVTEACLTTIRSPQLDFAAEVC